MGKFSKWFFEPFVNFGQSFSDEWRRLHPEEELIIRPPELPSAKPSNVFRPQVFTEYIGQEKAKTILKAYIKGTKSRGKIFPHTLIYGKAGCGKTTLAKIMATELNVNFIECIASEIKTTLDITWKIHDVKGGILFLDEIHSLDRTTVEGIYSIMEDFTVNGRNIQPFTLIGATTELGEILADRRPFYDRFKIIIELEDYTPDDIAAITRQYQAKSFEHDVIAPETFNIIGRNSRATPRMGIRLLETTVYLNGDVETALKNFSIIKDGYTLKDLKLLKYVAANDKGVGLQGLCSYLGVPADSFVYDIEPYLLQNNLLIRTPRGRKITQEGNNKIVELGG